MARPVRVYGNFGDFYALGGFWDDVTNFAKSVIPEKTIVGKAIRGDVSGATADAAKYAKGFVAANAAPTATATPVPVQTAGFGGLPEWVLPVAIVGVAYFMLKKRRR